MERIQPLRIWLEWNVLKNSMNSLNSEGMMIQRDLPLIRDRDNQDSPIIQSYVRVILKIYHSV